MEDSITDRRDERDDERERTEEAERRELEAAGWEPRGKGAKTIWRSPADGGWYAHYQAVKMQKEKGPWRGAAQRRGGMSGERRTYEDYEEMGRYLEAAQFAVSKAQRKSFDMFEGLKALTEDTVTMETRPTPTSYDETILEAVLILEKLRSELAAGFHAEIGESKVPPGKPRTPPPFGRGEGAS